MDKETQDRINAAREEVRRCVASGTVIDIHPFDMSTLLKNPTVMDVYLINDGGNQYTVVDGFVYNMTTTVKNKTTLNEMLA